MGPLKPGYAENCDQLAAAPVEDVVAAASRVDDPLSIRGEGQRETRGEVFTSFEEADPVSSRGIDQEGPEVDLG